MPIVVLVCVVTGFLAPTAAAVEIVGSTLSTGGTRGRQEASHTPVVEWTPTYNSSTMDDGLPSMVPARAPSTTAPTTGGGAKKQQQRHPPTNGPGAKAAAQRDAVVRLPANRRCPTCALFAAAFRYSTWSQFPRESGSSAAVRSLWDTTLPGGGHDNDDGGDRPQRSSAARITRVPLRDPSARTKALAKEDRLTRVMIDAMDLTTRDYLYVATTVAASTETTARDASGARQKRGAALSHRYWPMAHLYAHREDIITKERELAASTTEVEADLGKDTGTMTKKKKSSSTPPGPLLALRHPRRFVDVASANDLIHPREVGGGGVPVEVLPSIVWEALEMLYPRGGDKAIFNFINNEVVDDVEEVLETLARRDWVKDASLAASADQKANSNNDTYDDTALRFLAGVPSTADEARVAKLEVPALAVLVHNDTADMDDLIVNYLVPICSHVCFADVGVRTLASNVLQQQKSRAHRDRETRSVVDEETANKKDEGGQHHGGGDVSKRNAVAAGDAMIDSLTDAWRRFELAKAVLPVAWRRGWDDADIAPTTTWSAAENADTENANPAQLRKGHHEDDDRRDRAAAPQPQSGRFIPLPSDRQRQAGAYVAKLYQLAMSGGSAAAGGRASSSDDMTLPTRDNEEDTDL